MKPLSAIVILLVLYVPAGKCMSQTDVSQTDAQTQTDVHTDGDSTSTSSQQVVEAELISFGRQGLRVRSAAGEEKFFPLWVLQSYRLMNGRLEVKHVSGKVMVLPSEALGDSTSLTEGQWQMVSPDEAHAHHVNVEVIGRDGEEICLRTLDGKEEYAVDELVAYRVRDGKVQIRHESGIVLIYRPQTASGALPTAGKEWQTINGENSAGRKALFSESGRKRARAYSSKKKNEWGKAFSEATEGIPTGLLALGIACLLVNIAFLICFGLVICAMFLNGEVSTALMCIGFTCFVGGGPLMGLYYGWTNCQAWRIQKLMIVWSVIWVIAIALNVILYATLPSLLAEMDPRFAGFQG